MAVGVIASVVVVVTGSVVVVVVTGSLVVVVSGSVVVVVVVSALVVVSAGDCWVNSPGDWVNIVVRDGGTSLAQFTVSVLVWTFVFVSAFGQVITNEMPGLNGVLLEKPPAALMLIAKRPHTTTMVARIRFIVSHPF